MLWIVSTQIIQIRLILLETLTISNSEIIFAWFLSYLGKFIFKHIFEFFSVKHLWGSFWEWLWWSIENSTLIQRVTALRSKRVKISLRPRTTLIMAIFASFYHQALLFTGIKVFIYVDTSMRKSGVNPFCLYLYFETLFMVFALYFISDC